MKNNPLAPQQKHIRAGDYLFHENEAANSLFIVKTGTIAVRKRRGAAYVELGKVFSNEVLGEVSFFDRRPRSASAVALVPTEVLEITFESLDKIYDETPPYFRTIIAAVTDRLRKANELVRKLQSETVSDDGRPISNGDEPDARSVLAATADILDGSATLSTDNE